MPRFRKPKESSEYGLRLAALRKSAGINQEELGRHFDMSQQQISKYETGKSSLSVELYDEMARYLRSLNPSGFSEEQALYRSDLNSVLLNRMSSMLEHLNGMRDELEQSIEELQQA